MTVPVGCLLCQHTLEEGITPDHVLWSRSYKKVATPMWLPFVVVRGGSSLKEEVLFPEKMGVMS